MPTRPGTGRGPLPHARRRPGVVRPVTIVAGTLVVLTILLAPYLKAWLEQRSEIAALRADVADAQRDVRDLGRERNRWDDPAYVRAQARARLHMVMPGETSYVVLDDLPRPPAETDPARRSAATASRSQPWYVDVWTSVQVAGATP